MKPMSADGRGSDTKKIRRLLRHCESQFGTWGVPAHFDITTLVVYLSECRNRLIHLIPLALGTTQPSGIWLALPAMDVVIYEADTSRTHQEHIIAHELAHIVCEHTRDKPFDEESARKIFPHLDPRLVRDMLNRTEYSDSHELEAEVMASVILCRMNSLPDKETTVRLPETQGVLRRLERSFSIDGGSGA